MVRMEQVLSVLQLDATVQPLHLVEVVDVFFDSWFTEQDGLFVFFVVLVLESQFDLEPFPGPVPLALGRVRQTAEFVTCFPCLPLPFLGFLCWQDAVQHLIALKCCGLVLDVL